MVKKVKVVGESMKLRQLEILVAVKECGTITGAAEKLYISQPSLSTAMKEIDSRIWDHF